MLNAKEYLMQIKKLNYIIKNKQDEIEKLKCLTVSGSNLGEEYVQSSPDPHSKENLLIKIIQFKKELENDIDKLIDLKKEIMDAINKLDDADEVDVLYKRYIQLMCWEQIAVDKGVSIRHIYRIHGQALLSVRKYLKI